MVTLCVCRPFPVLNELLSFIRQQVNSVVCSLDFMFVANVMIVWLHTLVGNIPRALTERTRWGHKFNSHWVTVPNESCWADHNISQKQSFIEKKLERGEVLNHGESADVVELLEHLQKCTYNGITVDGNNHLPSRRHYITSDRFLSIEHGYCVWAFYECDGIRVLLS
jgi:hypothetical protein